MNQLGYALGAPALALMGAFALASGVRAQSPGPGAPSSRTQRTLRLEPRGRASGPAPRLLAQLDAASPSKGAAPREGAPPTLDAPPQPTAPADPPAVENEALGPPSAAATEPPRAAPPASPAPESSAAAAPVFTFAPGKGLSVSSADKRYAIGLRSRVQLRTSFWHDDRQDQVEASVKTLRLLFFGNVLSPDLKYLIQLAFGSGDFERDSASPIFDAFVEYVGMRDLNVRVGQYFVPFDRARTIREFALQFVDRQGVVRELNLDRDVGLMFSSQDLFGLSGRLAYNLFIGGGDGRNRVVDSRNAYGPQKPGVLLVGRLTLRPFGPFDDDQEGDLTRAPKPRLALGAAAGYNISSDRDRSTHGNTYTLGTFNYVHLAADLVFKWHGLSLLVEALYRDANARSHLRVAEPPEEDVSEYSRSGYGYFVQAGQMLGERLELTARFEQLFATDGTDPALVSAVKNTGRQVGGGLNFYLNGHSFKLQSDYFFLFGETTQAAQHVARLQLDASF